jgi:hypothetical protein
MAKIISRLTKKKTSRDQREVTATVDFVISRGRIYASTRNMLMSDMDHPLQINGYRVYDRGLVGVVGIGMTGSIVGIGAHCHYGYPRSTRMKVLRAFRNLVQSKLSDASFRRKLLTLARASEVREALEEVRQSRIAVENAVKIHEQRVKQYQEHLNYTGMPEMIILPFIK